MRKLRVARIIFYVASKRLSDKFAGDLVNFVILVNLIMLVRKYGDKDIDNERDNDASDKDK